MSESESLILKILGELREKHAETNTRLGEIQDQLVTDRRDIKEIRGDITTIRRDVSDLRAEMTDLRAELAAVEIRGATRDTELIASSRNLGKMLEDRFELRDRVERIETDVEVLKRKVG